MLLMVILSTCSIGCGHCPLGRRRRPSTTSLNYSLQFSSLLLYSRFLTSFFVCQSFSVLICPFECNILRLPLVGLPFILPSVVSCKSPSCLKLWPIRRRFPVPNTVQYWFSPFTLLRTSSLVTLPSQLFFSISTFQRLLIFCLSVCVNVHVSAAYSATLQTKHFIILFFRSRFTLPVNSYFSV